MVLLMMESMIAEYDIQFQQCVRIPVRRLLWQLTPAIREVKRPALFRPTNYSYVPKENARHNKLVTGGNVGYQTWQQQKAQVKTKMRQTNVYI